MIKEKWQFAAAGFRASADRFLRLLYPVRCPFCDEPVPVSEGLVCSRCLSGVHTVKEPFCYKCGKQLETSEKEYCKDCACRPHEFDGGRTLFVYEDAVRKSIYRFKYAGRKEYARAYAAMAERELGDFVREIKPDALIPVPLSKERLSKRGYNQAQLLAKELGRRFGVPVLTDTVHRVKNTLPQKELDIVQRQNNLKNAFKIN